MPVDVDVPDLRGFFDRMIYIDVVEMFRSGRDKLDRQLNLVLIRGADPPSFITIIACVWSASLRHSSNLRYKKS